MQRLNLPLPRAILAGFALLTLGIASADEPIGGYRAKLVTDASHPGDFLLFDSDSETRTPQIIMSRKEGDTVPHYFVNLNGQMLIKNGSLLFDGEKVPVSKNHQFTIRVPIESDRDVFELLGIDASGNSLTYTGEVQFPEFSKLKGKRSFPQGLSILPSLGFGYETSNQTGVSFVSQLDLRLGLKANYFVIDEAWNVEVDSYYAMLPFGSNRSGFSFNVFALDVRAGRKFLFSALPKWSLNVLGGWSYLTTFLSGNALGFKNVSAAHLYTTISYQTSERQFAFLNLKYGPVVNGLTLFVIRNSQVGIGGGYSIPLDLLNQVGFLKAAKFPKHNLKASLDYFRLGLLAGTKQLTYDCFSFSLIYDLIF